MKIGQPRLTSGKITRSPRCFGEEGHQNWENSVHIKLKWPLAAFLFALGPLQCAAAEVSLASGEIAHGGTDAKCLLSAATQDHLMVLWADVITYDDSWTGDFLVEVSGHSGNATQILQTGALELEADQAVRVAEIELGGATRDNITVSCDLINQT